jgi:cytochrome oxidase Cu insertion factor (SCO1/SenC/PrrC family)
LAIVLVGAAPMAATAVNGNTDPILSEALNGSPNALELPAPHFTLTDQHGQTVSLANLRGHTVALTFLDPVCTSDCPLIAQEFRQADLQLGSAARNVDFVAIVANPIYRSISFTNAFDSQESMNRLPNWYYLTGSLSQLQRVWDSYGVLVNTVGAGAMIAHSDLAFVIDGRGRERDALIDDPGPTQTFASSFSSLLLSRIDQVLNS